MANRRGQVDLVDRERIEGWAWDSDAPQHALEICIIDNGVLVAALRADGHRMDLEAAGIGDGRHGFSLAFPGGLAADKRHSIEVRYVDNGRALPGSPYVVEPLAASAVSAQPVARLRGYIDVATRERLEGWAWDPAAPRTPVALVVVSNGEVIGNALANRYREDLETAGLGNGRCAFSMTIAGGLPRFVRHVIRVFADADGRELSNSPLTIEADASFDPALEEALSSAVSALVSPADHERAARFLAEQMERVRQSSYAGAGREARLGHDAPQRGAVDAAATRHALVVDDLVPVVDGDASSMTLLSHMGALQALGYEVSFIAAEELSPPPAAVAALLDRGIDCHRAPYSESVEELLRRRTDAFDLVYLHRVANASKYLALAQRFNPKASVLYSVADLQHLRLARQAKVEGRPDLLELSRRLRLAECYATCAASAVITQSSAEALWLREAVKGANVQVVPWSVPVRPVARRWQERHGVAFIANFVHEPNADAARYLVEEIMPLVWHKVPMECLLVGRGMPERVTRLAGPRVLLMGAVPDFGSVYERVRLTVAPLRYGEDVKTKVLESLAAGVPCVMSAVAAEGIVLPAVFAGAIADDAQGFAAHILRLHSTEDESQTLARAGLAFIADGYSDAAVLGGLRAAVEGRH